MRIAYIFNHPYFLGGGEISLLELIKSIDRDRFKPIIVVPESGEVEETLHRRNENVVVTPFPPIKQTLTGTPFVALKKLINFLAQRKVDIIHANGSRACLYAGLAGRMGAVPVVWHVRETIRDFRLYDGLLGLLSNSIICVSQSVKYKRFSRFGRGINNKIHVVYNGVDTSRFSEKDEQRKKTRNELEITDKDILFGMIGSIVPLKGQDFFLEGLAKAVKNKPDLPLKTVIVGRALDPGYQEKLRRFVLEKDLSHIVLFQNYRENISEIYSALDVFVLSSKREGFSRSILEAMSSNLPVLASKIDEIEEAVLDGENGILVNWNDVDRLAAAIIQLAQNENMRQRMGQLGRQRVVEKFDLSCHVESVQNLYSNIHPSSA
jgi:glycosyltransferase involved in cell wall biosynthesis